MINIVSSIFFAVATVICVFLIIRNAKLKQTKIENVWIEKYNKIIFIILFFFFCFNLIFELGSIPRELHVDEAGAFYDAICLSKYGVDRYLNKWPVYLINFGGGQSALYAYLAAIFIKIGGVNLVAFRLPAVVLSLIACFLLYKKVKENKGTKEAVFVTFIFAILPWNIMKSRWGLDCNLLSSMLVISIYTLLKASNKKKNVWYVVSGITFGITLYTYAISYVIVPVLLAIWMIYMLFTKQIKISHIICFGIPLFIFAIPLILVIAYNSGWIENAHLPFVTIPKLWFYRGGEISIKNIPNNVKNILEILFIKDFLNYNSIKEFGTLYIMSIPIVICGFAKTLKSAIDDIKQKSISIDFIMIMLFIIEFCVGICLFETNINKMNGIYISLIYFVGIFISYISDKLKYGSIVVIFMYIVSYGMFAKYYFIDFSYEDLMFSELSIINASEKAEELDRNTIFVENSLNQTYIYTLIANPISPYNFANSVKIDNLVVTEYGKYRFELPNEIDENAVYIIKNDEKKINELLENNFKVKQYDELYVMWK